MVVIRQAHCIDIRPTFYPQGSMLIRNDNPTLAWRRIRLGCRLRVARMRFLRTTYVYNSVEARLRDHATYQSILEPIDWCLRLNYAGDFHLDVIPACPGGGGNSLKVPDRALEAWITSSPKEYADWFFKRCQYRALTLKGWRETLAGSRCRITFVFDQKYPLHRAVHRLKPPSRLIFRPN